MPRITADPDGTLHLGLEGPESGILLRLCDELDSVLEGASDRSDPVIRRLLPDAYESEDEAAEFRAMAGADLEAVKRDNTAGVREWVGTGEVPADQVWRWLATLTDLRVAIAARLGADTALIEAELDPSDPRAPAMNILHWLGWVQELSIRAAEKH